MDKLIWTHVGAQTGADGVGGVRSLTVSDLRVVFQPIVDLSSGRTFAHEALVRCQRPEFSSPVDLFERAVEETACGQLGRLIREVAFNVSGDIPLFLNLHPEELNSCWLVRPDDPMCLHPSALFLEITESAAFTHFELCRSVLNELCRRTSATLVVDDFGAGYSNLQRVADLHPGIVKLDLALTRNVHHLPRRQAVVRHVIALCRELGARVVAEGIETIDELKCVRDLGVHFAQGYLLARPAALPPASTWPLEALEPPARATPSRRVGPSPPVAPPGTGRGDTRPTAPIRQPHQNARRLPPPKPGKRRSGRPGQ
ncbi:MAG TPA: EAL domain-containing protein [Polyangiaceae bacterium]|nr:EAL domain-containing protein [Polyangiaceae bacterium]